MTGSNGSHSPWRGAVWVLAGVVLLILGGVKVLGGNGVAVILVLTGVALVGIGLTRGGPITAHRLRWDASNKPDVRSRRAVQLLYGFIFVLFAVAVGLGVLYDAHASASVIFWHVVVAAAAVSLLCFVLAPFVGVAGAIYDSKKNHAQRDDDG